MTVASICANAGAGLHRLMNLFTHVATKSARAAENNPPPGMYAR